MLELLTWFLQKHDDKLLAALLGLIGYLFGRWEKSRRPRVSKESSRLLKRLKSDITHEVKGITIHQYDGMINYWPFRALESDEIELGMVYELAGEYIEVVQCCEELLAKGYLVVEREREGGLTVYRLKS